MIDSRIVGVKLPDWGMGAADAVEVGVADTVADGDGVGETLGDGEGEADGDADAEGVETKAGPSAA